MLFWKNSFCLSSSKGLEGRNCLLRPESWSWSLYSCFRFFFFWFDFIRDKSLQSSTQGRREGKSNLIRFLLSFCCTGNGAHFFYWLCRRQPNNNDLLKLRLSIHDSFFRTVQGIKFRSGYLKTVWPSENLAIWIKKNVPEEWGRTESPSWKLSTWEFGNFSQC